MLNDKSEQIGIFPRNEVFNLSERDGVDIVLISPNAVPAVVKLIDFKKFLYQQNKKLQSAKKGIKKSSTKDIQLSLFIGQMDQDRLVERTKEFLNDGHQVRVKLPLKGRELGKKNMAFELISNYLKKVGDVVIAAPAKFQGRVLITVISRKKL